LHISPKLAEQKAIKEMINNTNGGGGKKGEGSQKGICVGKGPITEGVVHCFRGSGIERKKET